MSSADHVTAEGLASLDALLSNIPSSSEGAQQAAWQEEQRQVLIHVRELLGSLGEQRDALLEAGKQHAAEQRKLARRIKELEARLGQRGNEGIASANASVADNASELSSARDGPSAGQGRSPTASHATVPPVALQTVQSGRPPLSSRGTPRDSAANNAAAAAADRPVSSTNSFDHTTASAAVPVPTSLGRFPPLGPRPAFVRDSAASSRGTTPLGGRERSAAPASATASMVRGGSVLGDFNTLGDSASQVGGGGVGSRDRDEPASRRDSRRETPVRHRGRQRRPDHAAAGLPSFQEVMDRYGSHLATGGVCVVLTWLLIKLFR